MPTPLFEPYRRGPIHRSEDEYISFREVRDRFGFYGVKIGRWVTQKEQEHAAIHFYDALCDLMHILQVPEDVISLRGTLGLHYGTGGRPGVAAHYSPSEKIFALAKNAGPGSIAHEWFHAFDHYIAPRAFNITNTKRFGSSAWLKQDDAVLHPLNELLFACYQAILLDSSGNGVSDLFKTSAAEDRERGIIYYALPEELSARAFEAFIQDATIKNSFLVKGTVKSEEAKLGLYPQGPQRQRINQAFARYFSALGAALR
jgi:hypothetical protein